MGSAKCVGSLRYQEVATMTMSREWTYPHGICRFPRRSESVRSIATTLMVTVANDSEKRLSLDFGEDHKARFPSVSLRYKTALLPNSLPKGSDRRLESYIDGISMPVPGLRKYWIHSRNITDGCNFNSNIHISSRLSFFNIVPQQKPFVFT